MQTPPVGQRFGRYVVESQIGVGGMGVVYAAVDTHLQRQVALKVVSTQYASSEEFRERFQREAATLARLDSPHIIAIFDHGEEAGQPYLATQLVRGGDLGQLVVARGPLPPSLALSVCAQVADALTDAHAAGVVHRDIKPSNVLIRDPASPRLHAYLCDFGIALEESDERLTTVGGVVGTWAYLAPERSQGGPATPASDLYALGCLLWVCLTGEAPYAGTDLSVAMAHVTAPVRQLSGTDPLSRYLNEVFARSMAKDPAQRYASAAQMQQVLASAPPQTASLVPVRLPGSAPAAPPTRPATPIPPPPSRPPSQQPTMAGRPSGSGPALPPYGPPPPSGSRGRWVAVVAAAVAVLLVVGGVLWATRDDGGTPAADDPSDTTTTGPTDPTETTETTEDPPPPPDDGSVRFDLDGDGKGDAVTIFQDGSDGKPVRYTLTSDGSTFTADTQRLDLFGFPIYLDWNGDGTSEAIEMLVDTTSGTVDLKSDDPTLDGTSYDGITVEEDIGFVDVYAGDATGDGAPDLVVSGQSGPSTLSVWVLTNEGTGFADPVEWLRLEQTHQYTTTLATGDFDGDQKADLLASLPEGTPTFDGPSTTYDGPRGTRLFTSTGSSFEADAGLAPAPDLVSNPFLVVGDYSGDGTPLVALSGDPASAPQMLFFEVGSAGLQARPELTIDLPDPSGFTGSIRALASDVDGDGDDDLVLTKKISEKAFAGINVAISDGDGFAAPVAWGPTPRCKQDLCFLSFQPSY